MRPTEILKDEHRVIESVLDCLEVLADRCERERSLDDETAARIIDFLRTFADRCHHGKEEAQLFPAMEARGYSPDAGPVAVMLLEHTRGRELIRAMDEARAGAAAGDDGACRRFTGNARAYLGLLREHIQKEDHCLFPMADQALTAEDQAALQEAFRRVEAEEIGADVPERYRRIAASLVERLGRGVAAG
ncbi:MAG: hemerythrin domain-containing protein [Acidobacteriota bacterium]|jgi:hemerythrin-like domain-containing protein